MLAAAIDATTRLTIGIGLAPIDVFPVADLVAAARARPWPPQRGILGVAAGATGARCATRMREALAGLRSAGLELAVGSGGRGPIVLQASGEFADAVCLAWLTPDGLTEALAHVRTGAARAGRPLPPVYTYVRVGVGDGGEERVRAEMRRYARLPHHGDNRDALGRAELIGVAIDAPGDLSAALAPYRDARLVLRPVLESPGDLGAWEEAARDLAPRGTGTPRA
jgi:alkanesulfonate monooxygenase SsuD/methylene tetrahydromethanopterin reductase-like flavin-dependent oxidoreductase (luciferase family)